MDFLAISAGLKQVLDIIHNLKGFFPKPVDGKPENPEITTLHQLLPGIWDGFLRAVHQMDQVLREKDELIKELERSRNWAAEAVKYRLKEIGPGVFAYEFQEGIEGWSGPKHYICPNCFQDQRKSILQAEAVSEFGACLKCLRCQCKIHTNPVR